MYVMDLQKAIEDMHRKKEAEYAMNQMEILFRRASPKGEWERVYDALVNYVEDDAFKKNLGIVTREWMWKKDIEIFVQWYMQWWNNTVALPSYAIANNYSPEYYTEFIELSEIWDEEHRKNFFGDFTPWFSDEEHHIYQNALQFAEQRDHKEAHAEFGKLLPKYADFLRVGYNWVANWFMMYTSRTHWIYGKELAWLEWADTRKPYKKYNYKLLHDDIAYLKMLLKEYARLKKLSPTYPFWKKNRWIQSMIKNLIAYLEHIFRSNLHKQLVKHK